MTHVGIPLSVPLLLLLLPLLLLLLLPEVLVGKLGMLSVAVPSICSRHYWPAIASPPLLLRLQPLPWLLPRVPMS